MIGSFQTLPPALIFIVYLWTLLWKGLALWRASKNDQKNWFIALLVLNTMGIVEIIFIFYFSKKRLNFEEIKGWIGEIEKKIKKSPRK